MALGVTKRSTSEPPKKTPSRAVKNEAKVKKRSCFEFKRFGRCSKGNDCAYEHVAAAPESSKTDKKPPTGAIGAPVMFVEKEDSEECSIAACKDRRVTFPKLKTTAGDKKQYQKKEHPLREARVRKPASKDPQEGDVQCRMAF